LRIRALGSRGASDIVEREIDIAPDGEQHLRSFQRRLGDTPADASIEHRLEVPAGTISGTSKVELKIYPDAAAHVVEGLEALLQEPHGCFEQTSSTTYPNALVLDYLRRIGKSTPEVEKKAREYLALGYQRLLSFEVPGGGFSLFGHAPADPILTAYGIAEFHDMARVIPIDQAVIERTRRWLVSRQKQDGSFDADDHGGLQTPRNAIRTTAYIAAALDHAGGAAKAVAAARAFVDRSADQHAQGDAYTMALVAQLAAGEKANSSSRNRLLDKVWKLRRDQPDGSVSFETAGMTLMHGWNDSTEVTALAAQAFIHGDPNSARSQRAIRHLLATKMPAGDWRSTQATIQALKALLAEQRGPKQGNTGTVRVSVDATDAGAVTLSAGSSMLEVLDLARAATPGNHTVTLSWTGEGRLEYQLVQRWVEPRTAAASRNGKGTSPDGAIGISTKLSPDLKLGQTALEMVEVEVYPTASRSIEMPIVTVGVPPGCDVDMEELEGLVGKRGVERVERRQREVVFYFSAIEPDTFVQLPVWFKPRFPMNAQVPPARIYEYYRSDYGASAAAKTFTVRRASDDTELRSK
jgi:hypothetical protein